jgi:hypothetical protein
LLAGILLLAVLSRTAAADVHPVRPLSAAVYFSGYSGAVNGVGENGIGPTADLALGLGRTQVFLEGGVAWVNFGEIEPRPTGVMTRGGLGARWIARSFAFEDEGAIEMTLEAIAGASKIWWDAGGTLVRPDFGLGVAIQARKFRSPHASLRFQLRAYFAPTDDEVTTARCTRPCAPATGIDGGLMFSIGVGL